MVAAEMKTVDVAGKRIRHSGGLRDVNVLSGRTVYNGNVRKRQKVGMNRYERSLEIGTYDIGEGVSSTTGRTNSARWCEANADNHQEIGDRILTGRMERNVTAQGTTSGLVWKRRGG
jgi:hypothetical protein